jgi:hypothetical protein
LGDGDKTTENLLDGDQVVDGKTNGEGQDDQIVAPVGDNAQEIIKNRQGERMEEHNLAMNRDDLAINRDDPDREIPFCNRCRVAGHWTGDCKRG